MDATQDATLLKLNYEDIELIYYPIMKNIVKSVYKDAQEDFILERGLFSMVVECFYENNSATTSNSVQMDYKKSVAKSVRDDSNKENQCSISMCSKRKWKWHEHKGCKDKKKKKKRAVRSITNLQTDILIEVENTHQKKEKVYDNLTSVLVYNNKRLIN